jgi:CRISPR-associated endonuclease Cas1
MARPRSDPFDALAIRAAIACGETTERAAYLTYASSAGRPYARSTFSYMLRSAVRADQAGHNEDLDGDAPDRWDDRSPVKPRILSLSAGGGLRVKAGSLIAFDNAATLTYSKSAKPPLAIVLSSAGGFVSVEAIRFAARANIAIVALDRAHGFLTVIMGAPKASAALLRYQVRADPVPIARAIVAAKIGAMHRAGALARPDQFTIALGRASTLDHIRNVEAQASRFAWPSPPALRWDTGPIPPDWRAPWIMRTRLDAKGKRGARHPINAMLNAAFAVTAGRLTTYIAAAGLSPAIGFLHADKAGRWSLAWDAIEPLRPMIEARIFSLVKRERFAVADFVRATDGSLRLAPSVLRAVLNECVPPPRPLSQAVRWIVRLIESGGSAASGVAEKSGDHMPDVERVRSAIGLGPFQGDETPLLTVGPRRKRR